MRQAARLIPSYRTVGQYGTATSSETFLAHFSHHGSHTPVLPSEMVLSTSMVHAPTPLSAVRAPVVSMRTAAWKPGEVAPKYLDGTLPADAGCDPLCLAALATPVGVVPTRVINGGFMDRVVPFPWSVKQRIEVMENRSPEEQKLTLQWMREAEIKHARLAMLAVV